jgi:putative salt-induced outer membrane protein YdiY
MTRLCLQLFAFGGAALFGTCCLADSVVLDNGDRLTGRIVRLEGGTLVLNTDYAGDVKINLRRIQVLESDQDMTVVLENDRRFYGRLTGNGSQISVREGDTVSVEEIPTGQISDIQPGRLTGEEWNIQGRINVGASDSSGNSDVARLNVNGEIAARKGRDRYTAGTSINYAQDSGAETESNAALYLKHDRFFTRRWYTYLNTTFEHDRFKDIKLRSTLGYGSGYQAIQSSRTNLALEGGIDYVHTDFYDTPTDHYPAARLAVKYDHYLLPDSLQFFYTTEAYVSLRKVKQSFARAQTGLRYPLRNRFEVTAQLNVDWDGDPQPGRESVDRIVLFTLGYKW